MSTTTAPRTSEVPEAAGVEAPRRPPLRLLWPTLALAAYWAVVEGGYRIELAMFPRFLSRMIATLALLLFFLIWGLSRRHFTWRQRLGTFAAILGVMIVAGLLADPTIGVFGMALFALPIALTAATLWLWAVRKAGPRLEIAGVLAASLIVFGVGALLRWDGMDGRQRSQLAWRWTPTAEQQFLATLEKQAAPAPSQVSARIRVADGDWASFRGGDRENVVTGVTLGDWTASPPRELWKHRVGPGWGSVLVLGDVIVTQEQRDKQEAVVCYRATDGAELWSHTADGRFDEALSGTGPRSTPAAVDDRVVAYGATGRLVCLDAATGKPVWSRDVIAETGAAIPQWGLSISPLIVDGRVVVFAGGKDDRGLLAYDLATGEPAWHAPAGTVSYSSPQLMTLAGVRQIVMQDEQALYAVAVEDGKRLWSHPSTNGGSFQPMIQPHLVDSDRLLVGWGDGLLSLSVRRDGDAWQLAEQWTSNRLKPGFNDVVVHDGHLYGLDDGILCCVSAADGKRIWKAGRYGFGQLLLLPDARELLVLTEKGEVVRVAATPDAHRELSRFPAIEGKTWNHPVIARDRLVVRNGEELACFDLRSPSPAKSVAANR